MVYARRMCHAARYMRVCVGAFCVFSDFLTMEKHFAKDAHTQTKHSHPPQNRRIHKTHVHTLRQRQLTTMRRRHSVNGRLVVRLFADRGCIGTTICGDLRVDWLSDCGTLRYTYTHTADHRAHRHTHTQWAKWVCACDLGLVERRGQVRRKKEQCASREPAQSHQHTSSSAPLRYGYAAPQQHTNGDVKRALGPTMTSPPGPITRCLSLSTLSVTPYTSSNPYHPPPNIHSATLTHPWRPAGNCTPPMRPHRTPFCPCDS